MRKIRVTPRHTIGTIRPSNDGLVEDYKRRLNNALRALDGLGPDWLAWVEQSIPQGLSTQEMALLAERGARCLVVSNYSSLWSQGEKRQVIFSDYPFTDNGNLKGYL